MTNCLNYKNKMGKNTKMASQADQRKYKKETEEKKG